jgi:hypothetical protein
MNTFLKLSLFNFAANLLVLAGLWALNKDKEKFNFKNQAIYQGILFLILEFCAYFIDSPDIQAVLICLASVAGSIALSKYIVKNGVGFNPPQFEAMSAMSSGQPLKKKKDDELTIWLVVGGIFSLVFLICEVAVFINFWKELHWLVITGAFILTLALGLAWRIVQVEFKDPNYDYWRKINVAIAVAGIILVMGSRAEILETIK